MPQKITINISMAKEQFNEETVIDTGAWIALNNKKDKHHIAAITANKHFLDSGYFYVTSDYIMDETYTLLRYDIGHEKTV